MKNMLFVGFLSELNKEIEKISERKISLCVINSELFINGDKIKNKINFEFNEEYWEKFKLLYKDYINFTKILAREICCDRFGYHIDYDTWEFIINKPINNEEIILI